jgi:protein TonB
MPTMARKWITNLSLAGLAACSGLPKPGTDVDQRAVIDFMTCARPEYPRSELQAGHEGTVYMEFLVTAEGTVAGSRLVRGSGFPALDQAALVSVSHCHFRPARKDGRPVQAWTNISYAWTTK